LRTKVVKKIAAENAVKARVHCFICSHMVAAELELQGKRISLVRGQRCPRCSSPLDAAKVVDIEEAA
jgi:DNA-directed RNA polymerase subunit RPC12/RpoP